MKCWHKLVETLYLLPCLTLFKAEQNHGIISRLFVRQFHSAMLREERSPIATGDSATHMHLVEQMLKGIAKEMFTAPAGFELVHFCKRKPCQT